VILLALMMAQAQPWVVTDKWQMYGPVNESCGQWLLDKDDEIIRTVQLSWAAGFLSGINLAGGGKATDVDTPSLVAYIDQQCAAKPLSKVAGIAVEFYYHVRNP